MSKTCKSSSPSSALSANTSIDKPETKTKIDPSFKSKRYRDKLRTEVKALEALLPVDRTSLSRKLDSQTVFRLVLALLRLKNYFQAAGQATGQPDSQSVSRHDYDVTNNQDPDIDDVTALVQGLSCLQVLEGFLLVLTADGTILYVSDNVLQYLGYNQVDLMHRCLYSIIHHDDMMDLKVVLETSIGHLVTRYDHPGVQDASHQVEECSYGNSEACKPVSFICRMRCFSGSTVGYLKMHCSGKIMHHSKLPKGKKTSSNVVMLFCNPFMLRASEVTSDLQKNVFWTKHDLDLNVKEMDPKGTDIIGFSTEEMEKQSFYTLVHPEDLTALATCHKMLVDSSDVQTVYFRMQSKGGDWVWLTSRAKVISKNAKRFSIAFSHCPLREEDSTFIQQEAVLRRRYAITDLMYLTQFRQPLSSSLTHTPGKEDQASGSKAKKSGGDHSRYQPYSSNSSGGKGKSESKKDEVGVLDTSCILEVACPSAWHAMSDRHSPVLPSSHVAHKISQREKQLQFQEFCRRQQMESGGTNNHTKLNTVWDGTHPFSTSPAGDMTTSQTAGQDALSSAGTAGSLADPHGFYPSESSYGGFGSCVEYNPSPAHAHTDPAAASFIHHWYNMGSVSADRMVNQTPTNCLTPSRSPHQCAVGNTMQGAVSNQLMAFQTQPSSCAAGSIPQHAGASAYSSMPPSPPPSPPTIRPGVLYQQASDMTGDHGSLCVPQQYYRSDLYPPYFPYATQPPPPPPYPRNPAASTATSSVTPMSTITDLQKTTEKFLPTKKERGCEKNEAASGMSEDCNVHASYSEGSSHNVAERWNRAAWTFHGQLDISWRQSMASQPLKQLNGSGCVNVNQPVSKSSDPSVVYGHQGFQEAQVIPNHSMFHPSVSQPTPQPYPYPSLYPHLGSPPAYPYGVYPQLGYQGGQYPVNNFYAAPNMPMKIATDLPRPMVERPLDLPSIGSFLEYLNEV